MKSITNIKFYQFPFVGKLQRAKNRNWHVYFAKGGREIGKVFNLHERARLDFISTVKSMINDDETTWFLCKNNFDMQIEDSFRWNEWEIISLESAENDIEWETEIKKFWNIHLPIIMSVKDGYSYYAISIENGSVVHGGEPEFEECKIVANSFEEFQLKIMKREILI